MSLDDATHARTVWDNPAAAADWNPNYFRSDVGAGWVVASSVVNSGPNDLVFHLGNAATTGDAWALPLTPPNPPYYTASPNTGLFP